MRAPDLSRSIEELERAKQVVETNAPINRREGDTRQAELETLSSQDFARGIRALKRARKAPKISPKISRRHL